MPALPALGIGNQQAAPLQQAHDAPTQAVEQPDNVVPLRAPRPVECGPAAPECVRTVQEQHVQVRVEVQRGAKSLDQSHCARPGPRCNGMARPPDQKGRDAALNDRQHFTKHSGLRRQQQPQRKRKRQDPLPDRRLGKHMIDQVADDRRQQRAQGAVAQHHQQVACDRFEALSIQIIRIRHGTQGPCSCPSGRVTASRSARCH
mgnify:CR=1 FL=1